MIRRDPRTWKLASEVTVRDFVGEGTPISRGAASDLGIPMGVP